MVLASPSAVVSASRVHLALAEASNSKKEMALAMDHKAHALSLLGEYDSAVKEIKNSYDKISPLIDAKKNLKNLKEDQKKKFMDEYELTKVRLDSEYESFEKIRIFYLQSGLDIFNSKIFD